MDRCWLTKKKNSAYFYPYINNYNTLLDSCWTVFGSLGSLKWNIVKRTMSQHSIIYTYTCNPYFWKGLCLNPKKRDTSSTSTLLYLITPVFLISPSLLCIQSLSGGGWVRPQPLHLWKICPATFNGGKCLVFTNVSGPILNRWPRLADQCAKTCFLFFW